MGTGEYRKALSVAENELSRLDAEADVIASVRVRSPSSETFVNVLSVEIVC
jgi:hypothetical protein